MTTLDGPSGHQGAAAREGGLQARSVNSVINEAAFIKYPRSSQAVKAVSSRKPASDGFPVRAGGANRGSAA